MAEQQSYRKHARFDPPLHFFVVPVLLINVFVAAGVLIHDWPAHLALHLWLVVLSIALLILAPVTRMASLRAQDRLIRLEQRLRFQQLLSPAEMTVAKHLNLRQVIALRFASDEELPGLVARASTENLQPKAIKEAIQHWQTDTVRV